MRQHVIFEEDCYLNLNAVAETLEQLVGEITPKIGAPEDHVTYRITVLFPYVAESDEPVELGVLENVALEFYKGTHGENGSMTIGEGVTYVVDVRLKFNGSTLTVRGSLINNCQIELESDTDRGWGNTEFADGAVYDGSGVIWVVAQENPEVRLGGLTQKYRFAQSEGFNNGTFYHKEASVEFTVSYDANGGSGAPAPQIKQEGETLILRSIVPIRPDFAFLGWAKTADATTAEYQPGSSKQLCGFEGVYRDCKELRPVRI